MEFFLWGHIKTPIYTSPVDSEEEFIARIVESAATVRQHPRLLRANVKFCCVVVGCVSRSVAVSLRICSKLVQNITFLFRILQKFCVTSKLNQTQSDGS